MQFILDRLKEPSTYNAIALFFGLFAGLGSVGEFISQNTAIFTGLFAAICATIGAFTPERGAPSEG